MTTKNRSKRARESAGLSIGQAARYLGITTDELAMIEENDSSYAGANHVKMVDIYAVNLEWLSGDSDLHDYASIDKMRGADRLTFHDRDVLAELAASIARKPAKTLADIRAASGQEEASKKPTIEEAPCYNCGKVLTDDDADLALCNECKDMERGKTSIP